MTFLKYLRLQRGWTQSQLAERLSIHSSLLSRLEGGWFTRPPTGLNTRLQEVFGSQWTFDRLMQSMPAIVDPPVESEQRQSEGSE
jgi:transcriptional regulator with XRE-family HTH domain